MAAQTECQEFFHSLLPLIDSVDHLHHADDDDGQHTYYRLRQSVRSLETLLIDIREMFFPINSNNRTIQEETLAGLSTILHSVLAVMWACEEKVARRSSHSASTPAVLMNARRIESSDLLGVSRGPGRPRYMIQLDQVTFLFNIGFSFSRIACMFLVHRTTLWRRLRQEGIQLDRYTDISDEELLNTVRDIYRRNPHCGVTMMMGHLRSSGVFVQHSRVRYSLRQADPANSVLRWGLVARRRVYSVKAPNSLWHIDGHHALIRWRMVTHGGIDGYSRLLVFLHCSTNNRAETVARLFQGAVQNYGLPSRVRADMGAENYGVQDIMENLRGTDRGSFIAGRSVHNTRIERLWRDLYYQLIQVYYHLFYHIESIGYLNVDSELDMFCLHYVYLPRINASLKEFASGYNFHGVRTQRSWTPLQMWTNGVIHLEHHGATGIEDISEPFHLYGIDPESYGIFDSDDDIAVVEIPGTLLQLEDQQMDFLRTHFDPIANSEDYGVDIYMSIRECMLHFEE